MNELIATILGFGLIFWAIWVFTINEYKFQLRSKMVYELRQKLTFEYAVEDFNDTEAPYTLYTASVEWDEKSKTFQGKVTYVDNREFIHTVTFWSDDRNRLQEKFQKSVETFLENTEQLGR